MNTSGHLRNEVLIRLLLVGSITTIAVGLATTTMDSLSARDGGPFLVLGFPYLIAIAALLFTTNFAPNRSVRWIALVTLAFATIGETAIAYSHGRLHDSYRNAALAELFQDHFNPIAGNGFSSSYSYVQSWPGMFAAAAVIHTTTGLSFDALLRSLPAAVTIFYLAAIFFISERLGRVFELEGDIFFTAASIFFIIGPRLTLRENLAPQTFAYVFLLFFIGSFFIIDKLIARILLLGVFFAAAVVTHVLTPIVMVVFLVAASVTQRLSNKGSHLKFASLAGLLSLAFVAWTIYVGILGIAAGKVFFTKINEPSDPIPLSHISLTKDALLVWYARIDTVSLVGIAGILVFCGWLVYRQNRRLFWPLTAFLAPALPFAVTWVVGLGEFRDRLLLFGIPGAAIVMAVGLHQLKRRPVGTFALGVVLTCLLLTLPTSLGYDTSETIHAQEIAFYRDFADRTGQGDVIYTGLAPATESGKFYASTVVDQDPSFFDPSHGFSSKLPTHAIVPLLGAYQQYFSRYFAAERNPYSEFATAFSNSNSLVYSDGQNVAIAKGI